jgi:hypothetical protein
MLLKMMTKSIAWQDQPNNVSSSKWKTLALYQMTIVATFKRLIQWLMADKLADSKKETIGVRHHKVVDLK